MTLRTSAAAAIWLLSAAGLWGQATISLHSGSVQYTAGDVSIDGQAVQKTTTNLIEIKNGQRFQTGSDSAAEVLLTPGVFVRLGANSAIRMDKNALSDTRVTLVSGAAMVECDELLDGNSVLFSVGQRGVELRKGALVRLSAAPARVMVDRGDAMVTNASDASAMTVKHGKQVDLNDAVPQLASYKTDKSDQLYQFSQTRSADSAYATGVVSSSLFDNGINNCSGASSWYLMGSVGMYAYLPCNLMFSNPFGYTMFGLNYGYLYDGPSYYIPPTGMFFSPAANSLGATGGGSVVGRSGPANTAVAGSGAIRVPAFGPSGETSILVSSKILSPASSKSVARGAVAGFSPTNLSYSSRSLPARGNSAVATSSRSVPSSTSSSSSLSTASAAPARAASTSGGRK